MLKISSGPWRVFALVLFVVGMWSKGASAQYVCVNCDSFNAISVASTTANNAAKMAQDEMNHLLNMIKDAASKSMDSVNSYLNDYAQDSRINLANERSTDNSQAHATAEAVMKAATPDRSTTTGPAEAVLGQKLASAEEIVKTTGFQAAALVAKRGAGGNYSSAAEELKRNCTKYALGLRDPDKYPWLKTKCSQSPVVSDPAYYDADLSAASLHFKQFKMPSSVSFSSTYEIVFKPSAGEVTKPEESEMRFVAAWYYCEKKFPVTESPRQDASIESSHAMAQEYESDAYAEKKGHLAGCFQEILRRTACGSGGNCGPLADVQKDLCSLLTGDAPYGLKLKDAGGNEGSRMLSNCQSNGVSLSAADNLFHHRGEDSNYDASNIANCNGDTACAQNVKLSLTRSAVDADTRSEARLQRIEEWINFDRQQQIADNLKEQNKQVAEQNKMLSQQVTLLVEQTKLLTQLLNRQNPVVATAK